MLSDRKKIDTLMKHGFIKNQTIQDFIKYVKYFSLKEILSKIDIDSETEKYILETYQSDFNFDDLKEQLTENIENISQKHNVIKILEKQSTYLIQAFEKGVPKFNLYCNLQNDSQLHFLYTRNAILLMTGLSTDILNCDSEEELNVLLSKNNIKDKHLKDIEISNQFFDEYKLYNILEQNNFDENFLGLKEIEIFSNNITSSFEIEKIGKKSFFIEGYRGSGKTTFTMQCAYRYSKENSFYIDLKHLSDFKLTQGFKEKISDFISQLKLNKGIVILDNTNLNKNTKHLTQFYFNESRKANIHLIYIATLEQHNSITNLQSFTELFFNHDWDLILKESIYIELSAHMQNKKSRLLILEHFLTTYLNFANKQHLLTVDNKTLEILDSRFKGILYLLKTAIDNQKISELSNLRLEKAESIILDEYKILLEHYFEDNYIANFLTLNSNDIYVRIEKEIYNNNIYKNSIYEELIKTKKLYKVDDSDQNNYVLFLPNTIIPNLIFKNIELLTNTDLLSTIYKKNHLNNLAFLSIKNIIHLLIISDKTDQNLIKTLKIINEMDLYQNNHPKLTISNLILIITSYINYNQMTEVMEKENEDGLILFSRLLHKKNNRYLRNVFLHTNTESLLIWFSTLNNKLKLYYTPHKTQLKTIKYNKVQRKRLDKQSSQPIKRYAKVLHKLIKESLNLIFKEEIKNKHYSENFKLKINQSLINFDGGYEWNTEIKKIKSWK